jgi:hypothetical protein
MIKNRAKDLFIWILEIYTKVVGKMGRNMDLENTLLLMAIITKDNLWKE